MSGTNSPTSPSTSSLLSDSLDDGSITLELDYDFSKPPVVGTKPNIIKRRERAEVVQWLDHAWAESRARNAAVNSKTSHVRLAVLNITKTKWRSRFHSAEARKELLATAGIPPRVYAGWDAVRWHFFPPPGDTCNDLVPSGSKITRYALDSRRARLAWTFVPDSMTTIGIAFFNDEVGRDQISSVLRSLIAQPRLTLLPFSLATLFSTELIQFEAHLFEEETIKIFEVQLASGFHDLRNHKAGKVDKDLDFAESSALVAGSCANVGTNQLFFRLLCDVALEVAGANSSVRLNRPSLADDIKIAQAFVDDQSKYAVRTCDQWIKECELWDRRASIVLQGLFNLITQRDSNLNISIARDSKMLAEQSQKIAYESRILAEESKKDSTSMKAIAAVTMLYLPGTFFASFLAMPIFQLDSATQKLTSNHMWLYWAVTVPLTIATVTCWLFWNWLSAKRQKLEQVRLDQRAEERVELEK